MARGRRLSTIRRKGATMNLFKHLVPPRCIDAGDWPDGTDGPRVLIENPDRSVLWAHAEILRQAGYNVATCAGPQAGVTPELSLQHGEQLPEDVAPLPREKRLVCPLAAGQRCALVEGADVVVTTTELVDGPAILAAHRSCAERGLVLEGSAAALARTDVPHGAALVAQPVTDERLLAAVNEALQAGAQA
jgi:hypothetical protein